MKKQTLATALAVAALALFALPASQALASNEIVSYFGTASGAGTLGGEFDRPGDVAVNNTGVGAPAGTIYVADFGNNRVQRFDGGGRFISAWGADVVKDGGSGDRGDAAAANFEICTVAAECKAGVRAGGNGTMAGNGSLSRPASIAIDGDTGYLYVSELDSTSGDRNFRISAYDAAGNFLFAVGRDVAEPDGGGAVEICEGGADVCRQGDEGSGPGEIGRVGTSSPKALGLAVSPPDSNPATGQLYLADGANHRVNVYDLDGANPTFFGALGATPRTFGPYLNNSTAPRQVAVDAAGILYASNDNLGGEIERYDTGAAAFLDPIEAPFYERQTVTLSGFVNGDRFTLTCPDGSVTNPITFIGQAQTVTNVVSAVSFRCGSGNIAVNDADVPVGSFQLTFTGANAHTDVPTTVCATVSGSGSCAVSEEVDGHDGPLLAAQDSFGVSNTNTSGLEISPSGALHVLRDPESGPTAVQQFDTPGAVSPPTADDDRHGQAAGFGDVLGLGLDGASGRLFVSAVTDIAGLGSGSRVYVLGDASAVTDPTATINPVTVKADTTATFSADVDPAGGLVTCKFQYSTDPGFGAAAELIATGCPTLALDGGPQAVDQGVSGLEPNTDYHVRIAVTQPFTGARVTSGSTTFRTDGAPPLVTNTGAVQVQDTSARLVGTIDPQHSQTSYVFEYGTTPALGSTTAPVDIGDGVEPTTFSQLIGGLSPDSDYHFRLRATNDFGFTQGSQTTFHTRAEPSPLPDDRAYEQVSPVDKNGGDAFSTPTSSKGDLYASPDGDTVAFTAVASFGEDPPQSAGASDVYLTHRTPSGWAPVRSVRPSFCYQGEVNTPLIAGRVFFARDFDHAVFNQSEGVPGCRLDPLDPDAPVGEPGQNLYRTDLGDPPGYDLLNPAIGAGQGASSPGGGVLGYTLSLRHATYVAAADDQSHVVFGSGGPQTPDSPPMPSNLFKDQFSRVYDWQQLGSPGCTDLSPIYDPALEACLRLASVDPAGNPFTTGSLVPGGDSIAVNGSIDGDTSGADAINAVSADGERVFFQNPTQIPPNNQRCDTLAACHLYMREGGVRTWDVSESECSAACGGEASDLFQLANPTGDRVLFTSAGRLTDADTSTSGQDLFLYTHSEDPASDPGNLTALSIDAEPADGITAAVGGVVGADEDLESAFFVASGQLVAGGSTVTGPKLYRWSWNEGAPELEYLARLEAADRAQNWIPADRDQRRERRVTPDGSALILESAARLDPVADQDADVDVYRWSEREGFQCVSCQLPGAASGGPSDTGQVGTLANELGNNVGDEMAVTAEMSTAITDDGQRIFFQTQDALVPEDTNGPCDFDVITKLYPCTDVYQWHDGRLSLITPGDSAEETDVRLAGTTPSGDDVFFATRQPLVGWDTDTNTDVYTARVGGGFPEPEIGDVCEGEACREGGSAPSAVPGAGTGVFEGPGNQAKGNPCAPLSKKLKRKLRVTRKAARKGQVRRARALRKQTRKLRRRAKRCNRRANR